MRRFVAVNLVLWTVGLGACGDTAVSSKNDVVEPDTSITDTLSPDTMVPDTVISTDTQLRVDTTPPQDSASSCEPGEGCFGELCTDGNDCLSGICSLHMGDYVCSKTCDAACPDGWSCKLVAGSGDGQYLCVSNYSHLCLPCETADGCTGDVPSACVSYPDGLSFCGGACDLETPCPQGFDCQEVTTTTGATSYQCVNSEGICSCSGLAISSGLASPCATSNQEGTCNGYRLCTEEGLQACDAASPNVETCNGLDDNCDGAIDEGTCDDGNACTVDACLGAEGCSHTELNEGECLDGDVCTVGDHCEAGVCVGTPLECDDSNPCTKDGCDELGGCSFVNQPALCDDGDLCTLGDLCQEGICAGTATLECDDSNPCTDDACGGKGCKHAANAEVCDDGNACSTASACIAGACNATALKVCDDSNPCTADYCDPSEGCETNDNTAPCDDGDTCTLGDLCDEGNCQAGGKSLICDDGSPCTDDACDALLGCVFGANTAPCNDTNECTIGDTCVEGACLGEGSLACDDGNPCTKDSCLLQGGCDYEVIAGPCSDGNSCTTADTCINGWCVGGAEVACDDANPCTTETCVDGDCVFEAAGGPCDDGNACTVVDGCKAGQCAGLSMLACDDGNACTIDSCDPGEGCVNTPTDKPCSDGDSCTLADSCAEGSCVGGAQLQCVDGNPCTDDGCESQTGCAFTPNNVPCEDDNACTLEDACGDGVCKGQQVLECNDDNPCTDDGCDPLEGCTVSNNSAGCDDGNACTANDSCAEGSCVGKDALDCNDGNVCTDDTCNAEQGCVHPPNTAGCDDDNVCTTGDQCSQGSCVPQGLLPCDDGNGCTEDSCDPGQGGCVHVQGDCPCGNDCWSAEGCLTAAGRCIRFSCRAGDQSQNFCQNCFGGEWKEITYQNWMNDGYCSDVIDKYRVVEGTATKCAGAPHCCGSSGACNGGDNAWHFWEDGGSNRYTGPCLGCNGDKNCTYWNGTDNGSYTRLTACERK
jgi:hypothetical protein